MLLTATGIARRYGVREVLTDATLSLQQGERVGVVGNNGAGKSTLARILGGTEQPDAGELAWRTGARVAYLSQAPDLPIGVTATQAVLEGLAAWREAMTAYERCGEAIEAAASEPDAAPDGLEALLAEQTTLGEAIERLGGWNREHDARAYLRHVGIVDGDVCVDAMSGGERRRVALAKVLLSAPDLAILDEPTNHLDVATIEWLERYLVDRFTGAVLLVTHDRYLLDRVATRTLEVEGGKVHAYDGGWGAYLEAKAVRTAIAERAEANRRNFLRRELEWLRRTPQARTTKQKARVERAEAALDAPKRAVTRTAQVNFGHTRSGRTILEALGLDVSIGDRVLARGLDLRLSKGEIVGIVGPNGCGKTTLLRTLLGEIPPAAGTLTRGKNTRVAYLDQERGDLDGQASIFENVAGGRAEVERGGTPTDVHVYLEKFLFTRHEQRKRVADLSGGERARVALAKILVEDANVVILDEPTNDLDVSTLSALEEALMDFPGTVLVVTHDRWFLDRVATSMLVFEDETFVAHQGGWADYVKRRAASSRVVHGEDSAADKHAAKSAAKSASKNASKSSAGTSSTRTAKTPAAETAGLSKAERRELEGLLDRISAAEEAAERLTQEVAQPAFYERDRDAQAQVFADLEAARTLAATLTERWETLEAREDT